MCSGPTVAPPKPATTQTVTRSPAQAAPVNPVTGEPRLGAGLTGKRADDEMRDQKNADTAFSPGMVAPSAPVAPGTTPAPTVAPQGFGLSRTAGRGIFSIGELRRTSVSSLKPGGYPKIRG